METKQTAVEWLEDELAKNLKHIVLKQDNILMESLFQQAKQMEKEQIINAFGEKRQFIGFSDNNTFGITEKTGQEYYNETYGK